MARGIEADSIQSAVYEELKSGIMTLKLKPGETMSAQEMATRLNVSRTPVREAFVSLQSEGLVDIFPQKGTVVSKINLERVEQERSLREALEVSVVEPFLLRFHEQDLLHMRALVEQQEECIAAGDSLGYVKADNAFHEILFITAGRTLCWDVIKRNNGHYDRLRVLTVMNRETASGATRQHEEIVALLQDKDADEVKRVLCSHLRKINYEKLDLLRDFGNFFGSPSADSKPQISRL